MTRRARIDHEFRHVPPRHPLLAVLAGALVLVSIPALGAAEGTWKQIPFTARSRGAAILDQARDRVIVFGGYRQDTFGDVWALDLSTRRWAAVLTQGTPPASRSDHAAIYDPTGDRIIVFGGYHDGAHHGDTWQLTLSDPPTWTQVFPDSSGGPGPRSEHSAIVDPVGNRMIVFGGDNGAQHFVDVWALSLDAPMQWTQITPSGALPSPRGNHAAVYDPVRRRMVIFGGFSGTGFLGDLWACGLGTAPSWQRLTLSAPPNGTRSHAAVYDPVGDRMLVFGGEMILKYRDRVLAFPLSGPPTWSYLITTGEEPLPRAEHVAVLDPVRARMIVGLGENDDDFFVDFHALSLTGVPAWTCADACAPPSVTDATAVLDPVTGRIVVFGGTGPTLLDEVWLYSLESDSWTQAEVDGVAPSPREGHAAILDSPRHRVLVVGGWDGAVYLNDTWSLSLEESTLRWTPLSPGGGFLTPRRDHTAVFDARRDRVVVFGGADSVRKNDVWELNLTGEPSWSQILPHGVPPTPRKGHTAIYDPIGDRMLTFGGNTFRSNGSPETWMLALAEPAAWTEINPVSGPFARNNHTAVYDPDQRRMIIFGGTDGYAVMGDAWTLSLDPPEQWTLLQPAGVTPPIRSKHIAIYDPSRARMIVHAGIPMRDTWRLDFDAATEVAVLDGAAAPAYAINGYPTPFSTSLHVRFTLEKADDVALAIYNAEGRMLRELIVGTMPAGVHERVWDGRDALGRQASAGTYFVRIHAGASTATERVVLIR